MIVYAAIAAKGVQQCRQLFMREIRPGIGGAKGQAKKLQPRLGLGQAGGDQGHFGAILGGGLAGQLQQL